MKPKFFVCDEPTANLDAAGTRKLAQIIRQLKAQGFCRRSSAAFLPRGLFIFTVSTAAAEEGGIGGTDTLYSITIIK